MINAFLSIVLSGFGLGYDGCSGDNYYFEVNTPNVDYGIVVELDQDPEVYCDVVSYKN